MSATGRNTRWRTRFFYAVLCYNTCTAVNTYWDLRKEERGRGKRKEERGKRKRKEERGKRKGERGRGKRREERRCLRRYMKNHEWTLMAHE